MMNQFKRLEQIPKRQKNSAKSGNLRRQKFQIWKKL
nr:MAG TPA: hypothetical protein [Caudoviricetes sp.]